MTKNIYCPKNTALFQVESTMNPKEFEDEAKRLDQDLDVRTEISLTGFKYPSLPLIRPNSFLQAVSGQIKLCRQLMKDAQSIDKNEALKDLIGFLEACGDR